MLADLHIHSTFSDGKLTIPEIIDLYGTRGFGAIAITDHLTESATMIGYIARILGKTLTEKTFGDYIRTIGSEARRARREYGMTVIPGFEISKNYADFGKSSHILALGVEKYIHADIACETIIDIIHDYGGIAVCAHPVYSSDHSYQTYALWKNRDRFSSKLDAWETANRTCFFDEVYKSGYALVASSDLHKRSDFDGWKTLFTCKGSRKALFDSIKNRDTSFVYYEDHILTDSSIGQLVAK
jgi:PHP family Zn ribbon phosphoesterase